MSTALAVEQCSRARDQRLCKPLMIGAWTRSSACSCGITELGEGSTYSTCAPSCTLALSSTAQQRRARRATRTSTSRGPGTCSCCTAGSVQLTRRCSTCSTSTRLRDRHLQAGSRIKIDSLTGRAEILAISRASLSLELSSVFAADLAPSRAVRADRARCVPCRHSIRSGVLARSSW